MDASFLKSSVLPAVPLDVWNELADSSLPGAEIGSLHRTDDSGPQIAPLQDRRPEGGSVVRAHPARPWLILQRIEDPDPERAHRQAHEDLAGGATGLTMVFESAPNAFGYGLPATQETLLRVLSGISPTTTHLRMDVHPNSRASVDWLVRAIAARRVDPERLNIAFGFDPAAIFAGTGRLRMSAKALLAFMPQSLAHFFGLGVPGVLLEADGRVYHNAGASAAQEIGAMMATVVTYLRMFEGARQPLVYAAPHIGFALSVDQDQLLGQAKLRAVRILWRKLQEACSIPPCPAIIHAETSWRMMSGAAPETNIVRSSIACMAAATGGADSISVLPHTLTRGLPDAAARAIARDTQTILAVESRVALLADPTSQHGDLAGLTASLCAAAWLELQTIEAEGGIMTSLLDGHFQARVAAARERHAEAVREGRLQVIGSTRFARPDSRSVQTLDAAVRPMPEDGVEFCERLSAIRLEDLMVPALPAD